MSHRTRRMHGDTGAMTIGAMIAIGIGVILTVVAIVLTVNSGKFFADSTDTNKASSDVSVALVRIDEDLSASEKLLRASESEVISKGKAKDGTETAARWLMDADSKTLYRQVWTNSPGETTTARPEAWPTPKKNGTKDRPSAGGEVTTYVQATKVKASSKFSYKDVRGETVPASTPVQGPEAARLMRVETLLTSEITRNGEGSLENLRVSTIDPNTVKALTVEPIDITPGEEANPDVSVCRPVTISVTSAKAVRLAWAPDATDDAYHVYKDGSLAATLGATASEWTDAADSNLVRHTYKVVPLNGENEVAGCASVSNTPPVTPPAPVAPNCPTPVARLDGEKVRLTWTAVANANSYKVARNGAALSTLPAGSTTYLDTTSSKIASYSYTVNAVSAAGLSSSCSPVNYTANLNAPEFIDSGVTGAGPTPDSWSTTGVPSVNVKWTPTPGATKYVLYVKKSNKRTNVVVDWTRVAEVASTGTLKYTVNSADFDTLYEWRVDAVAGNAVAKSTTMEILTAPSGVSASTKAAYGVKDISKGDNTVSWAKNNGANGYRIYAGDKGTAAEPASYTEVKKETNVATLSFGHTGVAYGSTYRYYVAPFNVGPRGVDAKGQKITGELSAPGPKATGVPAASRSAHADQLQFPPAPDVKPNGPSLTSNSRDVKDGTNRVVWTKVDSATGYEVADLDSGCKTSTKCTDATGALAASKTSFDITGVKRGAAFEYAVYALNATGQSHPTLTLKKAVTLYQRPTAPGVTITSKPTDSNTAFKFSYTRTADANDTKGFCADGLCKYQWTLDGRGGETRNDARANTGISANGSWGAKHTLAVKAWNKAQFNDGWSEPREVSVLEYPGVFKSSYKIDHSRLWTEQQAYTDRGDYPETAVKVVDDPGDKPDFDLIEATNAAKSNGKWTAQRTGKISWGWTASAGASSYSHKISGTTGSGYGYPSSSNLASKTHTGKSLVREQTGYAPGAKYTFTVTAKGASGLTRQVTLSSYTEAAPPEKLTYEYRCSVVGGKEWDGFVTEAKKGELFPKNGSGTVKSVKFTGKFKKEALQPFWWTTSTFTDSPTSGYTPANSKTFTSDQAVSFPNETTGHEVNLNWGYIQSAQTIGDEAADSVTLHYRSRQTKAFTTSGCDRSSSKSVLSMIEPKVVYYGVDERYPMGPNIQPWIKSW